jgi:serine/threonine protein kinase
VSPIEASKEPDGSTAISLADFDLIRVIGRGSYAKVLMVELKKTRRIYAMKVIKKELVTDDEVCNFFVRWWARTGKYTVALMFLFIDCELF